MKVWFWQRREQHIPQLFTWLSLCIRATAIVTYERIPQNQEPVIFLLPVVPRQQWNDRGALLRLMNRFIHLKLWQYKPRIKAGYITRHHRLLSLRFSLQRGKGLFDRFALCEKGGVFCGLFTSSFDPSLFFVFLPSLLQNEFKRTHMMQRHECTCTHT